MNGKLFLKRKREAEQLSTSGDVKREKFEPAEYHPHPQQRPTVISEHHSHTTPPPSPPAVPDNNYPVNVPNTRNQILLEALQKIVELQKELDDFERDLDYSDEHGLPDEEDDDSEISFYLNEHHNQIDRQCQKHEAEALGFAMCARETLLFLQQEGIPQDSVVYRTLREKLVGQVDQSIPI